MTEQKDGLGAVAALDGLTCGESLDRAVEGRLRQRRAAWTGSPQQPTVEEQAVELGMEVVQLRDAFARTVAELAELRGLLADRDTQIAHAHDDARAGSEELAALRRKIRGTLITRAVDEVISHDQLDQLLDDLDLEPVQREYELVVTVYAQQTVKVHLEADNPTDARERLADAGWMAYEATHSGNWEGIRGGRTIRDDLEIRAVTAVPGVLS